MFSMLDPRFECPICLSCLKDPMLTICGHRFCFDCIHAWLERMQSCPIDSLPLTAEKLFPDNYTKQEINKQKITCVNNGCEAVVPLLEADQHYVSCEFNKNQINIDAENVCPFKLIGCKDIVKNKNELSNHLIMSIHRHITLLSKSHIDLMNKMQIKDGIHSKVLKSTKLLDVNKNPYSEKLILCSLYERVVVLEQSNIEKDKNIQQITVVKDQKIEELNQMVNNLTLDLAQIKEQISSTTCNGVHVWRIVHFMEKLTAMRENPLQCQYYTPGFYTSSAGYKVCGRINLSADTHNISLFIHMMRGDYDDTLIWPFAGHINLSLIHPTDSSQNISMDMESCAESEAFRRYSFGNNSQDKNPKAFGNSDFVSIKNILESGFINNDTIVIKIIVKCL